MITSPSNSFSKECPLHYSTAMLPPYWARQVACSVYSVSLCIKYFLMHLARSTPPSLIFDNDAHKCFAECTMVDTSDAAWQQAQLSLSRGGLRLRRLSLHSPAAYKLLQLHPTVALHKANIFCMLLTCSMHLYLLSMSSPLPPSLLLN